MKNPNPNMKMRLRENRYGKVGSDWNNKSIVIVTQPTCAHCKELMRHLENYKVKYDILDISTDKGRSMAIESKSKTTPVVALMTSDIVNKYLSLDNISMKCMMTEILHHLK